MDRSAILERTPNTMSEEQLRIAEEEHNRRAEEQFRRLRLENITPETENTRTLEEMYATEEQAPAAPAPAPAPVQAPSASAADRLADYTPAPSQRTELFGNVEFKNGELVYHDAPQVMTAAAPSAQSEQTVDEDVRPTRRTMDTLVHPAVAEEEAVKTNVFAGLSTGTKTALIIVAAAVLVLIVSICICSSVLGSLSADIASYRAELGNLTSVSQALRSQIGNMTDPDFVDNYARTVLGMIR